MLCQHCNQNEATTYYKQTINGQTTELHLCPACAAKLTGGGFFSGLFDASPFPSWGDPFGTANQGFALAGGRRCPTCGLTESELRRTGRVGCGDCYNQFSDILTPYIKKLHGATTHVGTSPAQTTAENPVERLKERLKAAISDENYEEAARLRDEIRRQEGQK